MSCHVEAGQIKIWVEHTENIGPSQDANDEKELFPGQRVAVRVAP